MKSISIIVFFIVSIWVDAEDVFGQDAAGTRNQSESKRASADSKPEAQVRTDPNVSTASAISVARIEGRSWLIDADGNPFFAHGITHANNQRAKLDARVFSTACKALGFNAYGYGCPVELKADLPFIESWNHLVPISYYRGSKGVRFVDVFDPFEKERLDRGVKRSCSHSTAQSRNVIGFCWTDLGSWPLENPSGKNWVDFMRSLPPEAPGQKAYQAFLEQTKIEDPRLRDQEFLRQIAREYFRIVGGATRKYSSGKLVFGDRFAFNTIDKDVLKEMLPWVDAIAIQPPFWGPFPKKKLDDIHAFTGKPILLCDFAIRFKDGDKDVRMWKISSDSTAAGKAYQDYFKAALDTDYILGIFWCNPDDTPKGFGKGGVKQGFFADGLTERKGLHETVKDLNRFRESVTPAKQGD